MSFIFIVQNLQIKHKSGCNIGDEIWKWENNGNFMAPFGKKRYNVNVFSVCLVKAYLVSYA